jgi:two-component system NtrC family sensor kinase
LVCLGILIVIAVLQIRPLLPPLVMKPGRLTPFAIWLAAAINGSLGAWALWGARKRFLGKERDWFAGFLLLAAFIWMLGLIGFFLFPFRYGISWYIAGLARPTGVGVIFVGLLREQVWLYREARARQRDLEGLHTAGQALVSSLDPQRIVKTIATKALEVLGAETAILYRLDPQSQLLRVVSHAGTVTREFAADYALPVGAGVAGRAVAEGRPIWSRNVTDDPVIQLPSEALALVRREGLRAALAIPLVIQSGEAFGALAVCYREERDFADTDVELLSAYGTQAAVAIENARAFDQLALRARNDATLGDFSQQLLQARDEGTILKEAVRVTEYLLQADNVGLFFLDAPADCLRLEVGSGWDPGTVGATTVPVSAESFSGFAFLRRETVQAEDFSREQRFSIPAYLASHGARSGIAVPFGLHDQPLGVVAAYYREPRRFNEEDRRVLESVAHQTALALEKVRLYVELQANLQRLQETQAQLIQAGKLTALGTLLSGMAHEMNNPLSTILLSVQLLKQQQTFPDPVRRRLEVVEQEAERATKIIRDLLVFARRKPPERRWVNLNEVLEAALKLQAPEFDLNNIRVVKELAPTRAELWADPHQLQQVFLNLFTNATHALKGSRGRGTLWVRSSRKGTDVAVEVTDDGPGIPPEHLGRIFDPFFTTKAAGEGTGLGLSLSIGIIDGHGGQMKVENLSGAGARFSITLPIGQEAETAKPAAAADLPTVSRRGRILVVDDEDKLRATLSDVFTALGHRVQGAATGQEAIGAMEREDYDLVFLDLRLPDIHGKEVWLWTQSHKPALSSRVVFITGDTMSADTQKSIQETGRPLLFKPLTMEHVRRVVVETLAAQPSGVS